MNIVAILGVVDQQPFPNFSRICAQMLTVILRMMQQAHLLAMAGLIIRLCFALEAVLSSGTSITGTTLVASMSVIKA